MLRQNGRTNSPLIKQQRRDGRGRSRTKENCNQFKIPTLLPSSQRQKFKSDDSLLSRQKSGRKGRQRWVRNGFDAWETKCFVLSVCKVALCALNYRRGQIKKICEAMAQHCPSIFLPKMSIECYISLLVKHKQRQTLCQCCHMIRKNNRGYKTCLQQNMSSLKLKRAKGFFKHTDSPRDTGPQNNGNPLIINV